jgi:hypothetical protein
LVACVCVVLVERRMNLFWRPSPRICDGSHR